MAGFIAYPAGRGRGGRRGSVRVFEQDRQSLPRILSAGGRRGKWPSTGLGRFQVHPGDAYFLYQSMPLEAVEHKISDRNTVWAMPINICDLRNSWCPDIKGQWPSRPMRSG